MLKLYLWKAVRITETLSESAMRTLVNVKPAPLDNSLHVCDDVELAELTIKYKLT